MADRNASVESSPSSHSGTSAAATHSNPSSCETMLWEGWASQPSSAADEASTNTLHLPELASSSPSSRLSFHHQSDMLSTMLAHFHPLAPNADVPDDPSPGASFFQPEAPESDSSTVAFSAMPPRTAYLSGIPCPLPSKRVDDNLSHFLHTKPPLQMWQSLGPESPSSPLMLHNAQGTWPGATSSATMQLLQDAAESHEVTERSKFFAFGSSPVGDRSGGQIHCDHHAGRILVPTSAHNVHSEIHVHKNFEVQPSAWTSSPEAYPVGENLGRGSTRSQQFMNFVRIAQEQRSMDHNVSDVVGRGYGDQGKSDFRGERRKHRACGEEANGPALKRPHLQAVDHGAALWRNAHAHAHRSSLYPPASASQAMEVYAIGPALNTNGKPRARRGSATDPQSVYARHRREKINERFKKLQRLVPNGAKVDIVTMLDEAVHYVQFLQLQVKLLESDKYWMLATPDTYKGIDLTNPPSQM